MTALIKVQDGQIDVDRMIRLGMLSESYRYDAQSFLDYMRKQGYSLMDPEGWAAYQDDLRKTHNGRRYEAATYNRKIAAAKRILRFAWSAYPGTQEDKERFEAALGVFKTKKIQHKPIQPVNKEEVKALIATALEPIWGLNSDHPRPELALMIEFLFKTGCRISEMANVLLADIKPLGKGTCTITLLGKGNKQREVAVKKNLVDRIHRHFRSKQYLFESRNGGRRGKDDHRYRREYISLLINRCAKKALGRGFGAHNLRHSFASTYYDCTKDLYGLQKLLGHSSVSITASTYVHGRVDYDKVLEVVEF
jgi:integrase